MRLCPLFVLLSACPLPDDPETGKRVDDSGTTAPSGDPDPRGGETEVDTDIDTDVDTDVDTDTELAGETGIATVYWLGAFEATPDGEFVSGSFGLGYYGTKRDDWACLYVGWFDYEGPAEAACPDCAWAWDLSALQDTVADGDYCDSLDAWGDTLDGYFDYRWGFAETMTYAGYEIEDALLVALDGHWYPLAFNLPEAERYDVIGDAESLVFYRPVGTGYYYYDYPL